MRPRACLMCVFLRHAEGGCRLHLEGKSCSFLRKSFTNSVFQSVICSQCVFFSQKTKIMNAKKQSVLRDGRDFVSRLRHFQTQTREPGFPAPGTRTGRLPRESKGGIKPDVHVALCIGSGCGVRSMCSRTRGTHARLADLERMGTGRNGQGALLAAKGRMPATRTRPKRSAT